MPACPVCSHDNAASAKFCSECGAALSADPPREERKVVTVLFADLVGFTSRAEQLDPEDVRAVLAPYWERLRAELDKRGGTVEKFIGDAVMALFGAPVAHDDDPLRAVGAALAIRDWARDEGDVQVRIAVNTGEALVLLGARPAEGEGMAAGDVVNTTARLQSAAPVNGVLVGEATYRATRDVIEYREHEPVVAKGKSEPIPVWEAVQVRSRLGVDVESRPLLPMVGRTRELGVIVEAFERAKAAREPQLVTLVGVPGIGKSRLVGEFFGRLEDDPDLVWWRQGRALPYGEGVALWALAEMVKAHAGIDENDAADVAVTKLAASVEPLVDADERDWVVRHLAPLVGGESGGSGGESAPAWRRYFEGMAEQRPLVLVFEDMHWADDTLLDFVDHLVEWAADVPLLVIATARPELLDRRPGWAGGKLNTSTIALTPLTDDESAQIIHGVLDQAVLPVETQQALLDRAGGNPLYAEQFALLYMERGTAEELPLPETVHGLIAARLDGLSAEEKRVVQDGAVYGKVFWAGAVAAAPATVHALERKGLLRRDRRSSVGGETQYAFRHVLVRDVAYGQIPRAVRGDKHLAAAEWIERLGRADDHAELLAHHLLAAESFGIAADGRTRHALRRAGTRALALGVFPTAARHLAAALERWPDDDAERASVLAEFATAQIRANGDDTFLEPAVETLEAAGRFEDAVELSAFAAMQVWYQSSRHAVAQAWLERGHRLLAHTPPLSRARASLLAESARQAMFDGDFEIAERLSAEALELATRLDLDDLRSTLTTTTGVLAMTDGHFDEARRVFDEAAALASPGSSARFRALANRATVESLYGDFDAWRPRHTAALEEAQRAGDRPNIIWLESNAVYTHHVEGRWDEALRAIDSIVAAGRNFGDRSQFMVRAMILADRGDVASARSLCDEALAAIEGVRENQVRIPVHAMAAWVSLELGDTARAATLVEALLEIIADTRMRAPGVNAYSPILMLRTGNGERWRPFVERAADSPRTVAARLTLDGRWNEAAEAWRRVSPQDEAMVRLHSARELMRAGNRAEAQTQLERGLAFYRAVGAVRVVREAESLLAAAAAAE